MRLLSFLANKLAGEIALESGSSGFASLDSFLDCDNCFEFAVRSDEFSEVAEVRC